MSPEVKYERIGKFIYGACRHGGDLADVYNWMADDLGITRPTEGDDASQASVQAAYFAKYVSDTEFDENHRRFMEMIALRRS